MKRVILHIDMNSYFATVEQQANPRLRGKPIGVTGGDRLDRTVLGAVSVEAKKFGVKTGMHYFEAKRLCPEIILVRGDSDKYLECTKKFLNILKNYSPYLEVFSIDESFIQLVGSRGPADSISVASQIKQRIRSELGEWMSCSIGISYNKLMAKLASDIYKPDGLVMIADQASAEWILDRVQLDDICGIGSRIKKRLLNMGVYDFKSLRQIPKASLIAQFKSYGEILYNMARGIDERLIVPFYAKEEVKSIGHRHTLEQNTNDPEIIRQLLLKLSELVSRRARAKKLVGKTVNFWLRYVDFSGAGVQGTIKYTNDGLNIFEAGWKLFNQAWQGRDLRMIGVAISNLKTENPKNLSLLEEDLRQEQIIQKLDSINDKYGEFTLKRAVLLDTPRMKRMPNPFLSDRRFKI